ncbi:pyridoxal phosphate homeostasis protein-like isoform X2 [Rhagoletis pomonella]|uniref:pyridoxal phosphate homeostasis protein-like isoform X2 n=1 Tax=Rhagoletis pomonella TaxID=28610 RepID=UPI0017869C6F|nr:pyridoxal phosphate homeostasis protein-like isoform X2 [Rhagoletis pomonella]
MLRAMSEVNVKAGIECILKRIEEAYARRPVEHVKMAKPLLVAVSKTKPVEMIIEAYTAGQRHFGENYVQELVEKAQHPDILQHCPEIKWHFIGHLQNNKINKILKLPNLYMIQTVDSEKLATGLDSAWGKIQGDDKTPLSVLIQVNTSGEEAKNGVQPKGLMTIGAFGFDYTSGPNPDFISLMNVHRLIFEENALEPHAVQVSMGMSDDFEKAIEAGSTIVRVGSAIFGFRPKKTA